MFSFARAPLPAYRSIGIERSAECALIHAESFAHPWDESDFEQLLISPDVVADGAVEQRDEALCGFVLTRIVHDEAEILTLAVAFAWRSRGVGARLLSTHVNGLAVRGVSHLFLEVDVGNAAARRLYAGRGFHEVGERRAYYRKKNAAPATGLIMRLDLGA